MAEAPVGRSSRTARAFVAAMGVLSLVVAAGSGLAIATIHHVEANIVKYDTRETDPNCTGFRCLQHVDSHCVRKACNYLVLGSDSRAGLSKQEQKKFGNPKRSKGQRSDTILVVQVDAKLDRTIVLSIPRDLRVDIPGHGFGKINTAFDYGPDVIVHTVENLTGLRINHYVEVNFLGFENLVNALGGVPICIDKPLVDPLAGLNLPRARCYTLNGAEALAFVRARHVQGDIIPDFSRISRQQKFMRALIQKALSAGSIFHLPSLIQAVQDNLILDKGLNLYELQDLTRKLAKLGQGHVLFRIVPSTPVTIGGVDYVQLVQPDASTLFERIRDGRPLYGKLGVEAKGTPVSPANVTVQILDANSGGQADQVASYLERAGFVVLPIQSAPGGLTKSEVLWNPSTSKEKDTLASYLTSLPVRQDTAHTQNGIVTVVVGADFPGIEGA